MRRRVGLIAAPVLLLVFLLLPLPSGMTEEGWRTAAVGLLMATWWVTEAIPIPATALLPLVLFPLLGIAPIGAAAEPFANPIIFLFLGGFILAGAMQRWALHRRIALGVVHALGTRPHRVVLGFMVATAFLSMWVSNTATAVMMMPIGLSVIALVAPRDEHGDPGQLNFGTALMLGIAYAASIGGLATLIGTPPNALLAGYMQATYGVEIGFARWMLVGLPLVVVALPVVWLLLTRVTFPIRITEIPGGRAAIRARLDALGAVSAPERRVAVVFVATALAWVSRPLLDDVIPGLSDAGIAMAAAVTLFLLPAPTDGGAGGTGRLMDWESAESLPWGVLLLFGGGLSLAAAVTDTGLADWIGSALSGLDAWPTIALVLVVTAVVIFLTELTSNTATAAALLPVLAPLAVSLGEDPLLLAVPAAIAASCAFMMPVATPPNAIVYGSGYVTIPQMVRAGLGLNVMFILLITVAVYAGLIGLLT
ncbi:MAG TPA: DASS family sodium-coupled anion symporter [Longimicrobiales bacterium]|nr:DASS family sodium-coupled anion symporter [Longimicrobiales bacterium]